MIKEKNTKMMEKSSIRTNYIYNLIYQILTVATPLITSPIVSRKLGAELLGVYSYSYSIAFYFMIFGMLGVKNYGNRSVSQVRDDKEALSHTFWSIYSFQLLSSTIFIVAYIIYVVLICKQNTFIALIQIQLVLTAVFDISWLFFGLELFKITTFRSILIKIINVLCIIGLIHSPKDLWIYTFIMAGCTLLTQVVMWPFVMKLVYFRKPSFKDILKHFKPNILLFIPVIATNLYKYMNKIMLGNMSEMSQLGFYENAERLIQIPNSLITALGTVMLPRISNIIKNGDIQKSNQLIENSMMLSVCASSALAFGIAGVSIPFVPLFFGSEFIPVSTLLYILAPTMIFISWADVIRTQYLIPNMKDINFLASVVAGAVVNLVINFILIPSYGAVGASIGALFAEGVVCLVQTMMVIKELPIKRFLINCYPFVLIGAFMFFVITKIEVSSNFWTTLIRTIVGGLIYLSLVYAYMRYKHKDLLKQVLPEKLKQYFF